MTPDPEWMTVMTLASPLAVLVLGWKAARTWSRIENKLDTLGTRLNALEVAQDKAKQSRRDIWLSLRKLDEARVEVRTVLRLKGLWLVPSARDTQPLPIVSELTDPER